MADNSGSLYPRYRYYSKFLPEKSVFHANLPEIRSEGKGQKLSSPGVGISLPSAFPNMENL